MKKFLTTLVLFILVSNCTAKPDPIRHGKIHPNTIKNNIKNDLNYFLLKHKQRWSKQNKKRFVEIVYKGQKEFGIKYKIVLSIISIESRYHIQAVGKNRKTTDYGLTQQNSKYMKKRYKRTEKYLKKNNLRYSRSKFDMCKNVFSCFMYLKTITKSKSIRNFKEVICAYNVGIRGVRLNKYQKPANRYYQKFIKEHMNI